MVWTIEITARARKSINNLDKQTAIRILSFLSDRLAANENPRQLGKQLTGPLKHYWSYRVGDYRLLCEIIDTQLIVLVLEVGNRREIYR
ncbi:type II toxin-antitoxin system RelE/ParE family toxin [Rhizobium herbae]|uniref:Type II toxin-antitoxin system RelE/ParE family toxin n=1 Tax=Rhizobium herbae TaxID=508661 RepID=A0ABS7HAD1_9HYPH|nr:type II toxin-antitoxin system RelE/ParE family toxin [Rhizobium herbae]MBW9064068.1 type II toxin-antitoxin system RelE/ParE family toxin [Rhizobium herbae]